LTSSAPLANKYIMSSETRMLMVLLAGVGMLACGCLCLPIGVALTLPAVVKVRQVAAEQSARRAAQKRAESPVGFPRPMAPAEIPQPVPWPSDSSSSPPPFSEVDEGADSLSESRRRQIYRSATIHERGQELIEKQIVSLREQGLDTSGLERMIQDMKSRQEQHLERLCRTHKLTRDDLDKILAEGKAKEW
jgi:hypothetical protein